MNTKLAACFALASASLTMGKKMDKGKSTLEIEWKNNKGEKKHFTINDIEKEFKSDEIKGKTFLQEGIKVMGKLESQTKAKAKGHCGGTDKFRRRRGDRESRSNSLDCRSENRYKYPTNSRSASQCSKSRSISSRSASNKIADDYYGKNDNVDCRLGDEKYGYKQYAPFGYNNIEKDDVEVEVEGEDRGYENFRPYKREKVLRAGRRGVGGRIRGQGKKYLLECDSGKCKRKNRGQGKALGYRGYSKQRDDVDVDYGYGASALKGRRSISRGSDYIRRNRSRSGADRNVFTVQHKPYYDIRGWDVGCEPPVKEYVPKPADLYKRRANDQAYINRDRNDRRQIVNKDDVNRFIRNERGRRNKVIASNLDNRNNKNAKETLRYLNKNNKKEIKDYNKEACSADVCDSVKNANSFKANLNDKKTGLRHRSLDAKNSQNLMNIKDRCKEGLCLKEMDNDNLRSDEKVIEEFDKLEHYKKVNECNRSAEKNNNCNVNKRNDVDKNAATVNKNIENGQRDKRTHAKENINGRNAFDYNNAINSQKNSKVFKDGKECFTDDKVTDSCADNRSNDNTCQDSNSCELDKQDYDNLVGRQEDKRARCRDDNSNERVCALDDQDVCNDELENRNDTCI
jgi:hypothetical protein